jgi:dTDP-4-dehydrorhamnose 3,5-epimerase
MDGVELRELLLYDDERGWLGEIIRDDESAYRPVMSYLSMTKPGFLRGPHEHRDQTDLFCFMGKFRLYLWDNRETSITYRKSEVIDISAFPAVVIVSPRIVHAYKNTGNQEGLVLNMPDKLYKGHGKTEPVDEIRYEDDPDSPFRIED